jgi:hypothetical protein
MIVFIAGNHESNGLHSIVESYSRLNLPNILFFDRGEVADRNGISYDSTLWYLDLEKKET